MVEDLCRLPYFHILMLRHCLGQRKVAFWQVYWLDLVSIYQYAKNIKIFQRVKALWPFLLDDGRTNDRIFKQMGTYAIIQSNFDTYVTMFSPTSRF